MKATEYPVDDPHGTFARLYGRASWDAIVKESNRLGRKLTTDEAFDIVSEHLRPPSAEPDWLVAARHEYLFNPRFHAMVEVVVQELRKMEDKRREALERVALTAREPGHYPRSDRYCHCGRTWPCAMKMQLDALDET